jgi:Tfp pilus assembly protein PilF
MENDYFSAIFNFYDVLNEEPSNINARLWVAYILTKLGDTNKAIEEYHKVLRMDPFNSNAKKALSLLEKR